MLGVADAEADVVEELAPTRDAVCQPVDLERAHERAYDGRSSTASLFSTRLRIADEEGEESARAPGTIVRAVVVLVAVIATSGAIIAPAACGHDPGEAATQRPVRAHRRPRPSELRFMPHARAFIGDGGPPSTTTSISDSLCCPFARDDPARAVRDNTGVWSNGGSNGGFERRSAKGSSTTPSPHG